jgi:hypothetical protein
MPLVKKLILLASPLLSGCAHFRWQAEADTSIAWSPRSHPPSVSAAEAWLWISILAALVLIAGIVIIYGGENEY